jgi:hypothetical protein
MIDELMLQAPPAEHQHHRPHHAVPTPTPGHSAPAHSHPHPTGPTPNLRIAPTGPSQWQPTPQPMSDPPGQHLGGDGITEPEAVPPPVRLDESETELDRGSLFDTLEDPFSDDSAAVRTYRPVRPSNYQTDNFHNENDSDQADWLRPISKRPLPQSYDRSSRRPRSVR